MLSFSEFKKVHEFLVNAQNSFSHFDSNKNGKLGREDVFKAPDAGHGDVDETAIKHACKAFDPDQSNDLSSDQYIGLVLFLTAARKVFTSFDRDGSGKITVDFNQFVYADGKDAVAAVER